MENLFTPYDLAGLALPNRIVMAPMTRARAINNVPDDSTALYYRQRASAGLIITEGVPVSREGEGYVFLAGLYNDEQVAGWSKVTEAVHAEGGRIFSQLWHVGRVSHVSLQRDGQAPVSPVARQALNSPAFGWIEPGVSGPVQASEPRALATEEMSRITNEFVEAGRRAMRAGFDGVEVHAANGYLFEQFINAELNTREDRYGGSIANRLSFLLETIEALAAEIGSHRIGVRISPFGRLFDMHAFEDERATWLTLASELNGRALAYVHLSDQRTIGAESSRSFAEEFREVYRGTLIAAGGFNGETAEASVERGTLDLVGFGSPFIANPDLVHRLANGWPLAKADRSTYYGAHGARGYTDYPTYSESGIASR